MKWPLACLVLIACSDRTSTSTPPPVPKPRVDATALLVKFECTRCHDVPAIAEAPRDKHCVRCHQQIHDGSFEAAREHLARWQGRITSLRWAPTLAAADRLRQDYIRDFLLAPHDVRPGLPAQMPRLPLSRDDAERIAAHLSPDDIIQSRTDGLLAGGDPAKGEQLYRGLACGRCHRFTGATVDDATLHASGRGHTKPDNHALAPDLRRARDRVRPSQLAAWIAKPRGAMPDQGVTAEAARDLAAYIARAPLAASPVRNPIARLPVLERPVLWAEVETKVFRNLCWHCHAVPDYARGDGGPGNSGGFGYAPRGLDVSSYAGISSGSLDEHGEPRSIFAALPDGTPRVVAHLLARYAEEAGSFGTIVGMPLGLPPIPLEQIQLVESWIAQGRPQ
ncbi:MAG: c-type cytochrome [Myxococcota bacterium]|nr:cytochrome c [Deltaproteobacteria bacterium]MDQ3335643.1 c-type cytochrome [Myxococcota bacterium]